MSTTFTAEEDDYSRSTISKPDVDMSKLSPDQLATPVPRDIDISQAIEGSLPHITEIAKACGILESELEPYGRSKAKVSRQITRMLRNSET